MKTTATREEAMRAGKSRRMRVVFEIDVSPKLARRKFNQAVATATAELATAVEGEGVLLTVEEVRR